MSYTPVIPGDAGNGSDSPVDHTGPHITVKVDE